MVEVTLVAMRSVTVVPAKLVVPEIFKLVEVTPIPTTVKPPIMVVDTPVAPIWMPPAAPPVPMAIVVVPGPVAIFTVDDVPMPRDRVWATLDLPTVMRPGPADAPLVRALESDAGLSLVIDKLVPVALAKLNVPSNLVGPET